MTIKCDESLNKLQELVSIFENNDKELTDVPQEMIDKFGFSCLANSLMFKEPKIPKYDDKTIVEYMKTHEFPTVDSLCNYVKSLEDDINKLFAIFTWAALNIIYDMEALLSGNIRSTTLEEVFKTKKAVCSGYAVFYIEMTKRTNIDTSKIIIKNYSNLSKGYGYNHLNPPKYVKSDHASVFIEINGSKFISEPTWGAGGTVNNEYKHNFRPEYFLIPIYRSLNDHYPCDNTEEMLPFKFPLHDYVKSCKMHLLKRNLKTESIPFVNFECKDGYLEQIYSCVGPIDFISFRLYLKKNNTFYQISEEGIIGYEIIQKRLPKHPERCRFRVSIAFPQKGFYKIEMFIDTNEAVEYYVNNLEKSSISIPLSTNCWQDQKFIPIIPKKVLTNINLSYAVIRFAVSPKRSGVLCRIFKLNNKNSFEKNGQLIDQKYYTYATLKLPFDDERYEDIVIVNFPFIGRYAVDLYLSNDIGSYNSFITYYFDVNYDTKKNFQLTDVSHFLYSGRSFTETKYYHETNDEIIFNPNFDGFLVNECNQTFELKTNLNEDAINVQVQQNDHRTIFPKIIDQNDCVKRFQFTLSNGYGSYNLFGWFNHLDQPLIKIKYFYVDDLKEPDQKEIDLLNDLKKIIDQEKREDNYKEIIHELESENEPKEKNKTEFVAENSKSNESTIKEKDSETKIEKLPGKKESTIKEEDSETKIEKLPGKKESTIKEKENETKVEDKGDKNKKSKDTDHKTQIKSVNNKKDTNLKEKPNKKDNNESQKQKTVNKPITSFVPKTTNNNTNLPVNNNKKEKEHIKIKNNKSEDQIDEEKKATNKDEKSKQLNDNNNHKDKNLKNQNKEKIQNNEIDKKEKHHKSIISIENFNPNNPIKINDPFTISALKNMEIEIKDITYPDDIVIQSFCYDPKYNDIIKEKLFKCVDILIKCVKKERKRIIHEFHNHNLHNQNKEINRYKQKVDEIKDYIKKLADHKFKMKPELTDKEKSRNDDKTDRFKEKEILKADDSNEKQTEKISKDNEIHQSHIDIEGKHTNHKFKNEVKFKSNLTFLIEKNNQINSANQYYINNHLMKSIKLINNIIHKSRFNGDGKLFTDKETKKNKHGRKRPVSIMNHKIVCSKEKEYSYYETNEFLKQNPYRTPRRANSANSRKKSNNL